MDGQLFTQVMAWEDAGIGYVQSFQLTFPAAAVIAEIALSARTDTEHATPYPTRAAEAVFTTANGESVGPGLGTSIFSENGVSEVTGLLSVAGCYARATVVISFWPSVVSSVS